MDERITTSYEGDLAYAEIHMAKYQGSVMTYVDRLIGLNEKANMSGRAWHSVLVNGLPHELRKDLAKLRGGKPKEDDALLSAIEEIGLTHEEFHRDEKLKDKGPEATSSGKGKGNGKRKWEPEKANATAKEDSAPTGKKAKKAATTWSGSGQPRFSKDQEDEALKGIPDNLREARGKKKLCIHCGLNNHGWQWCRREISVSSTHKTEKKGKGKKKDKKADSEEAPAASSIALKRKAPTNNVSVGVYPLPIPDRILAYLRWKAGDSKRPRTAAAATATSPQRIWEVDSEAEEKV